MTAATMAAAMAATMAAMTDLDLIRVVAPARESLAAGDIAETGR